MNPEVRVEELKEILTSVYSELICIESAVVNGYEEAAELHLTRAINLIGDPRGL